jgi:hypothetical protein
MFMPQEASLRTIYSYYLATVNVNPEGDVNLSDELNLQGLGTALQLSFVASTIPFQNALGISQVTLFILNWPYWSRLRPCLGIYLLEIATTQFLFGHSHR